MKQFELDGLQYECEDKYNFFAKDEDEDGCVCVWVYVDEPVLNEEGELWWNNPEGGCVSEVTPITLPGIDWKESKGKI